MTSSGSNAAATDLLSLLMSSAASPAPETATPTSPVRPGNQANNDLLSLLNSSAGISALDKVERPILDNVVVPTPAVAINSSNLGDDGGSQLLAMLNIARSEQNTPGRQQAAHVAAVSSPPAPVKSPPPPTASPFHFISPFDALEASFKQHKDQQTRAVSSPAVVKSPSPSGLPPLPTSPPVSAPIASPNALPESSMSKGSSFSILDLLNRATQEQNPANTAEVVHPPSEDRAYDDISEKDNVGPALAGETPDDLSAHDDLANGVVSETQNGFSPLQDDSTDTQSFQIDLTAANEDLATDHKVEHQGISRFKSASIFSTGRQIAVNGYIISYATRAGRIRVIDSACGAKIIKKVHAGLAGDMAISPEFSDATSSGKKRRLASVSTGRLVVWEVPSTFDSDDVQSDIICDLSTDLIASANVTWIPNQHNSLTITKADGTIFCIDIRDCRGIKEGREAAQILQSGSAIKGNQAGLSASAISEDGSMIVVVTSDNLLSFYALPSLEIIASTLLSPSCPQPVSAIALLGGAVRQSKPAAIAISRHEGNVVEVFSLRDLSQPSCIVRLENIQQSIPNFDETITNFGQLLPVPGHADTLALSCRNRKSVFLLSFNLASLPSTAIESLSDAKAIEVLLTDKAITSTSLTAADLPKVGQVKEIKLQYAPTQLVISGAGGAIGDRLGLFYLHPEGFDQVGLDAAILGSPVPSVVKIEQEKSLEAPEMERQEEEDAKDGGLQLAGLPIATDTAGEPKEETVHPNEAHTLASSAPVLEALLAEQSQQPTSNADEEVQQQISNMREADASPLPLGVIQPASTSPQSKSAPTSGTSLAEQLGLPAPLSSTFLPAPQNPTALLGNMQSLFVEQARLFETMLITQQRAEKARYEQILGFISETLTTNTQQMVERALREQVSASIRSQIEERLLPELLKAFGDLTGAVDAAAQTQSLAVKQATLQQIRGSVVEGLANTLPQHFDNITRQMPSVVAPSVDASIQRAFGPHFERLESLLSNTLADHSTAINDVRSAILNQQMKAEEHTARLEIEMGAVRRELGERMVKDQRSNQTSIKVLQTEFAQLRAHLQGHGVRPADSAHSPSNHLDAATSNGAASAINETPLIQPAPEASLLDGFRSLTPTENYEDIFLGVLRDNPHPLVTLVDEAPAHRLAAVLPPNGHPVISVPNILALCLYIAREFANGEKELGSAGEKRLAWLLAAFQASKIAKRDTRYKTYLPRVYTDILHGLSERRKVLTNVEDIESISIVLQAVDEGMRML